MWDSNQDIITLANTKRHLLPKNFDYLSYLKLNPDLAANGILSRNAAINHYLVIGRNENRLYNNTNIVNNIDLTEYNSFDENFYLSEYPDVGSYFQNAINVPLKQKLFHHYHNYGKNEGRFKNQSQQNSSLAEIDNIINDNIYQLKLSNPTNKLEAVCLLTTAKEIRDGRYSKFISHLIKQTHNSSISQNIVFNIVTNRNIKVPYISKLQTLFKKVNIVNLKLKPEEDIYIHSAKTQHIPLYGFKSGPNITFFKTIQYCYHKYDTCLFLETDCKLSENWLKKIFNYVCHSNGFLISGATYDGNVFVKAGSAMLSHINGGTAIYSTNNAILQQLCQYLSEFIVIQTQQNMPGLAYDYALKLLIDYQINNIKHDNKKMQFWKFINRNYVSTKLIVNYCLSQDSAIDNQDIIKLYNPAILHQKK
jgi:hypothetical protein